MNKMYDRIISFGCSFTEGGGLDSYVYHNYKYNQSIPEPSVCPTNKMKDYATLNAYPNRLAKIIGCESENYGKSTASNEYIFNTVYNRMSNYNSKEKTLVIIQTTLLNRLTVYDRNNKKFLNINNTLYAPDEFIKNYYEMYLTHYYDEDVQWNFLIKNIDLYNCWLTSKNIDVIFLPYWVLETAGKVRGDKNLYGFPVIKVNNTPSVFSLSNWANTNLMQIEDLDNYPENNRHFSEEGHQKLAEIVYDYLTGNGYG